MQNTERGSDDKDFNKKMFYQTQPNNFQLITDENYSPRINNHSGSPGAKARGGGVPTQIKYKMSAREQALAGIRNLSKEYAPDEGFRGDL